jgi:hypothetical protein
MVEKALVSLTWPCASSKSQMVLIIGRCVTLSIKMRAFRSFSEATKSLRGRIKIKGIRLCLSLEAPVIQGIMTYQRRVEMRESLTGGSLEDVD